MWAEGFWAAGFWADGFWSGQATTPTVVLGGGGGISSHHDYHDWRQELADAAKKKRIHAQNQSILAAVMAAMAEGMFE